MNDTVQIIPSILCTNEQDYKAAVEKINDSQLFDDGWVQIDIMDNKFVPNKSVDIEVINKYPLTPSIEVQLMVEDPKVYIAKLLDMKIKRIIFPIEVGSTEEIIELVKNGGAEVGLSLNLQTPIENVKPFLSSVDLILVMSVDSGFSGQQFNEDAFDRVKQIAILREQNKPFLLEVDGGVKAENAVKLIQLGVNNLVVNSALMQGDIAENLETFWTALYEYR